MTTRKNKNLDTTKPTKPAKHYITEPDGNVREKGPADYQRENDGPDHGVRGHSRAELEAKHGRETLDANEEEAANIRARKGI